MGKRSFTPEYKVEAVRLLTEGHRTAADVARELGISANQLYKRRIVGWAAHSRITAELVVAAFRRAAVRRRPRRGLILHSDQGKQYRSGEMAKALHSVGAVASMGSAGDCYDNAAMERFFGSLKSEWLQGRWYETRQEAARDIGAYVDGFYDSRRPHSTLGGLTPAAFEAQTTVSQLGVHKNGV